MIRQILILMLGMSYLLSADAQNPIAEYGLDCSFADETGMNDDIQSNVAVECTCGLEGDALVVQGNADQITVDTSITDIFDEDFGISFYFLNTGAGDAIELLSVGNNCSSDSTFRIIYLPTANEVRMEFSQTVLKQVFLSGNVKASKCWHHVVVTRMNNVYEMYLDGVFQNNVAKNFQVFYDSNEPFQIGQGACNGVISTAFEGYIDELKFYNFHIQEFLVNSLYIRNDEIITNDTTMFVNDVFQVQTTVNCTGNINWTPSTGLSATDEFMPDLTGIQTTQYIAQFIGDECISTDTLRVNVIEKSDVDCEEIILPNVFTPNGDGLNDDIGILNGFIIESFEYIEIFDRWGELVFSSTDKADRWDGSFKGQAVNSNMFLYKISYTCGGGSYVSTGSFSILR